MLGLIGGQYLGPSEAKGQDQGQGQYIKPEKLSLWSDSECKPPGAMGAGWEQKQR